MKPQTKGAKIRRFTLATVLSSAAMGVHVQAQDAPSEASVEWLRWGPIDLRPRVATSLTYDDNITLSRSDEFSDFFWSFTPGLSLMAGERLTSETPFVSVDYDANLMVFNEHTEFNDLNHSLGMEGRWPMAKLTLGMTGGYDMLSTPLIYTSDRIDRSLYRLGLTAHYQYSEKTSFDINGHYDAADYGNRLIGSKQWSNDDWMNHQLTGKLNLGLGVTFGYLEPDLGPSQKFQRISMRANYVLTYKLNLDASVGEEFRQYEGFPMSVTPVFSLGATYRPVDRTTIRLNGYRREQSSVTVIDANQVTTGMSLNVRQQVWDRIGVSAGGSYENSEYRAVRQGVSFGRSDDYFAVNIGMDITLTQRWNAGLTAQHRENTSDSPNGIVFDDNQVSLQTSYSF